MKVCIDEQMLYGLNKNIDMAKKWLLYSGIQCVSKDKKINGGFNSWFDLEKKKYPFIYSEITGCGITTLLYLYKITKNKEFLNRAVLAAEWIIKVAMQECGAVKTRYYYEKSDANEIYSFDNQISYAFDNGTVLNGMINLYKINKNKRYLDAAVKMAEFLLFMQKKDGLFYSMYDAKTGEKYNANEKWSSTSGSYHAKLSIGLLDVFDITGENKFKKSSEKICNSSKKFQKKDGRFTSLKDTTHFHPHLYTVEGLVYANCFLEKNKFIKSATAAVEWTLNKQLNNGGIPTLLSGNLLDVNERSDILAQVLRMGAFMMQKGYLSDDYKLSLLNLKNRLLQFQNQNNPQMNQQGGFFYGQEGGVKINHINSWCTMFSLQALDFYSKNFKKEKIELDFIV
jgi:hypothetical protein